MNLEGATAWGGPRPGFRHLADKTNAGTEGKKARKGGSIFMGMGDTPADRHFYFLGRYVLLSAPREKGAGRRGVSTVLRATGDFQGGPREKKNNDFSGILFILGNFFFSADS